MTRIRFLLLAVLAVMMVGLLVPAGEAQASVFRASFSIEGLALRIELLDDDLAHFELSTAPQPADMPISTTVMVAMTDHDGPSAVEFPADNEIATPEMHLRVHRSTLCVTVTDRIRDVVLTTICPSLDDTSLNGLTVSKDGTTDIYGLGEQFRRRIGTDGNWIGTRRTPGNQFGNSLVSFEGGNVGNVQIPVLYALGESTNNYALLIDHVYPQAWAFNADPFTLRTPNSPLRWYVMTGSDLPDLRSDYLELTGRPPVPPRQLFGLWVSEYGYENWAELEDTLASLRAADFPVDGFVLDLQWFGGIGGGDDSQGSQMGSLAWDETNFPDPAGFMARLRDEHGIGIMTIEEPFVSTAARGYAEAEAAGVLVSHCGESGCEPVDLNSWWGSGSMVDWSNPQAAAWWHDERRQALVEAGVMGHWTDLGEPENYDMSADYFAGDHAGVHNVYNLLWSQSIAEGYRRQGTPRRPFILSRSGTAGSQRFGVALWSGDIAANMPSLAAQMNVRMHVALSGIDFFGSDVGGFKRQATDPVLQNDGMYTLWLANAALTDIPLRPHASNLQNAYETAPSLIGDVPSNLANVRLRYALGPYLYTLAHQAFRSGEAVFPPPVYHFQADPAVRALGGQVMIGSQMMMAALADYDPETTTVYLPRGGWFNFRTGAYTVSTGETLDVQSGELVEAPLFVRDGAIIPLMSVDEQTGNMLGIRLDGSVDNTLVLNVYHAAENGSFTLIEDDGETIAYQSGAVRETVISHQADGDNLTISVGPANGGYSGALDQRPLEIRLFSPARTVARVLLNGDVLANDADTGWTEREPGQFVVKIPAMPADTALTLTFESAQITTQTDRPLLLTHYMPWYQTPEVSGYWGWHWTMNHFDPEQLGPDSRPQIASQFMPLTGPYDSQDAAVLEYQVLLMKLSGIDGVIVDWYGTADFRDYATLNIATGRLYEYVTRAGLQFSLCYEDRTVMNMVGEGRLDTESAVLQGQTDMQYAYEQWFSRGNYVSALGQPLLFVFGPMYFRQPNDWTALFTGLDPVPGLITLDNNLSFGSLSNYPWPPMGMAGGAELAPAALESYLERFYRNARRRDLIVGSAFPGFYDIYEEAGVRSSYGFLDARDGETLRSTLDMALTQGADIVQLVTWNDYGEGTTIEPTEEYGYQYLEIVQRARQNLDSTFALDAEALRLPLRLLNLRRQHADNAEVSAQLDHVFDALVEGDIQAVQATLDDIE